MFDSVGHSRHSVQKAFMAHRGTVESLYERSPIALITGPSGAGKTQVCRWMAEDGFLHLDGDLRVGNGINESKIRSEWNQFWERGDPGRLAETMRKRAVEAGASGTLLSLPSTAVFNLERVTVTRSIGLQTILLFGCPENCIRAFLARERTMAEPMDEAHWHRNNDHACEAYRDAGFDAVRLEAFRHDGSRWSRAEMVGMVRERLGQ